MSRLWSVVRQAIPPAPQFIEKDMPDLSGRVCIVTGANTGVGKEVARIIYGKNATVWAACRTESKAKAAISEIKTQYPDSKGQLRFLKLDLGDLSTIKNSAETFLAAESSLDLLITNAGVMVPPTDMKTAQGYDLQLGTNCLGHFLFVKLLAPTMVTTAKTAAPASVRVIWVSSSATENSPAGGVPMDNLDYKKTDSNTMTRYSVSKAGNYYHGMEFAKIHRNDGVVSVALNPGNLKTDLTRYIGSGIVKGLIGLITYPPVNGAYTELFAALHPDVTMQKTGSWIVPWGRFDNIRPDLAKGSQTEEEGGTGIGKKFWDWSEEQVKPFL